MPEPYKIKSVEMLNILSQAERDAAVVEAGYNTFLLKSEDVLYRPVNRQWDKCHE